VALRSTRHGTYGVLDVFRRRHPVLSCLGDRRLGFDLELRCCRSRGGFLSTFSDPVSLQLDHLHLQHPFPIFLLLLLLMVMFVARHRPRVKAAERLADVPVLLVDVRPRTSLGRHRRLPSLDGRCRRVPGRRLVRGPRDDSSPTSTMIVGRTVGVVVMVVGLTTTGMWLPEIQREAVADRPPHSIDNREQYGERRVDNRSSLFASFVNVQDVVRRRMDNTNERTGARTIRERLDEWFGAFSPEPRASRQSRFAGGTARPTERAL